MDFNRVKLGNSEAALKRKRKSITLDIKLNVLNKIENGERVADVGRLLRLPSSTVHTIIKNKHKIRECAKNASRALTRISKRRDSIILKMESLLLPWILQHSENNVPIKLSKIQEKAKSLCKQLKDEEGISSTSKDLTFAASRGWFHRFRQRYSLKSLRIMPETSEAASNVPPSFLVELETIIKEGRYSYKQIFNVDETGLYWKKLPEKTCISESEQNISGFKASKDRLSILLGCNAYGDKKLKPLVAYYEENPKAFKDIVKSKLPVHWKSQRKAWINKQIFREWLVDCASNELEAYCKEEKIPFNILLILDNSASHNLDYELLSPNIKVVFVPPSSTSNLQPMDQEIITTFKAYYLKRLLNMLIEEVENKQNPDLGLFWKNFNILHGVHNIALAWEDVNPTTLNISWKTCLPQAVHFYEIEDHAATLCREIVQLAKHVGFHQVTEQSVTDLIRSHIVTLTTKELLKLEKERLDDENEEDLVNALEPPKSFTVRKMKRLFELSNEMIGIIRECDPIWDRASKVIQDVQTSISCYRKIYREKNLQLRQPNTKPNLKSEEPADVRSYVWVPTISDSDMKMEVDSDSFPV